MESTMKKFRVTSGITQENYMVEAVDEWEAVRRAQEMVTGEEAKGEVTWHGMHAEVGGCGRWERPVAVESHALRTVKVRYQSSSSNLGSMTPTFPNAKVGHNHDSSIQVTEITDVPDDVSDEEVARLWAGTGDCTWLSKGDAGGRHSFKFGEIGIGKMIRE